MLRRKIESNRLQQIKIRPVHGLFAASFLTQLLPKWTDRRYFNGDLSKLLYSKGYPENPTKRELKIEDSTRVYWLTGPMLAIKVCLCWFRLIFGKFLKSVLLRDPQIQRNAITRNTLLFVVCCGWRSFRFITLCASFFRFARHFVNFTKGNAFLVCKQGCHGLSLNSVKWEVAPKQYITYTFKYVFMYCFSFLIAVGVLKPRV